MAGHLDSFYLRGMWNERGARLRPSDRALRSMSQRELRLPDIYLFDKPVSIGGFCRGLNVDGVAGGFCRIENREKVGGQLNINSIFNSRTAYRPRDSRFSQGMLCRVREHHTMQCDKRKLVLILHDLLRVERIVYRLHLGSRYCLEVLNGSSASATSTRRARSAPLPKQCEVVCRSPRLEWKRHGLQLVVGPARKYAVLLQRDRVKWIETYDRPLSSTRPFGP
jgi:hypothetical protein